MAEPYTKNPDSKPFVPYAIDQVTFDNTVTGVPLTLANTNGCQRAIVCVETAQIRYTTTTATVVTTALGILANPGDQIILIGPEIQTFRAIRTGAVSGVGTTEYSR